MDFRASYGEKITGESWLMRDLWQTTNMNYGAKWGLATNPKKLQSIAVKRLLDRALWEQGIRHTLPPGKNTMNGKEPMDIVNFTSLGQNKSCVQLM
jgi:hypothetical protein